MKTEARDSIQSAEKTLTTINKDTGGDQRLPLRIPGQTVRGWTYL